MDPREFVANNSGKGTVNTQVATETAPAGITEDSSTSSGQASGDTTTKPVDDFSKEVIEEYLTFLADNDVTKEDVFSILDAIITEGTVLWSFKLFDKIKVVFRMRPTWVNSIVLTQIEKESPKTYSRFTELIGTYNLAGSLVQYGDKTFELNTEEDLFTNKRVIEEFGFIIHNHLIRHLSVFDRAVAVATSDWAIENFTPPQSDG